MKKYTLKINNMRPFSRRKFLTIGGVSLATTFAHPILAKETLVRNPSKPSKNITILMQGDSITDAGRNRGRYYINDAGGMGGGYVFQIVAELLGRHPESGLKFYNRGISGNNINDLTIRWKDDCIQLMPDVLSILIGVNDFWHTLNGKYKGTATSYETGFRKLLDQTMNKMPDVKLIIGEPFAVKGGKAINERWYPEFPKYQKIASNIAKDFNAQYINYQEIFDEALRLAPVSYWCPDGVHPSMAGGHLMKAGWIEAFEKIY